MYSRNMIRVNRSPDGGEGNGGAPAPEATPAPGNAGDAAPAPEYVSKSDFERFSQEINGHLSRLTPQQQAAQDKKDAKSGSPSRPKPSDYDFQKDPSALERYEDDLENYRDHLRESKRAERDAETQTKQKAEKNIQGHRARLSEYKKENPTFDADIKAAGPFQVLNEVRDAVFASKDSPAIVHHIAKNKDLADELNELAETEGLDAVRFRLGEIAGSIKAERKALDANKSAAGDIPPRQSFRGNSPSKDREPTMEERFSRYNR